MSTKNVAGPKRQRWGEREARAALAEYKASGLEMAPFARARGYTAQRLRRWRDLLEPGLAAPSAAFVPVVVREVERASSRPAVVITAEGDVEVMAPGAVDASWLGAVVAAMRRA